MERRGASAESGRADGARKGKEANCNKLRDNCTFTLCSTLFEDQSTVIHTPAELEVTVQQGGVKIPALNVYLLFARKMQSE